MNGRPGPLAAGSQAPAVSAKSGRFHLWHTRVLSFCLIIFALEIGLFLVIFPWTIWWELNWIPVHSPGWNSLWMSRYCRGAVSGIGLLNVYVAFGELFRQLKSIFFPEQS